MTTSAGLADGALADVQGFLRCPTPPGWFAQARANLPLLLIDHANCEKKAASTALGMLFRYLDRPALLHRLSRLAREELRHFEQVHALMQARGIEYVQLSASRYAAGLMARVRGDEPGRLVDTLLVGAVVEARSCERFAGLIDVVPEPVASLYRGLIASEARHFRHYLELARDAGSDRDLDARLGEFLALDAALVTAPDREFRFHSGPMAG